MPSWSGIRSKLENDYLAPSLRGRIEYLAISYSRCPDHEGRAAVRLDGKEVLKSSYYERCMAEYEAGRKVKKDFPELSARERCQLTEKKTLESGAFDQRDFYNAFQEYDNQSIENSILSENPIVRMFVIMDRRLGKRRLIRMEDAMEREPDWLRFFYELRMDAEQIRNRSGALTFSTHN